MFKGNSKTNNEVTIVANQNCSQKLSHHMTQQMVKKIRSSKHTHLQHRYTNICNGITSPNNQSSYPFWSPEKIFEQCNVCS
ncbi:hypothetical protein GDO78_011668 [Eleutherodactylus coqui]|uniref:Uncharacterized protein n=1 Tax=Eleutherodactylus coqui TaxID=57060 RepID=A0A8J6F296_ELECQ|nr:hypothetical protein GDO78_011668 [Eleutherodactylus coqui]